MQDNNNIPFCKKLYNNLSKTSFCEAPSREAHGNRRADGGLPDSSTKKSHNINKLIRNMADVCEAFCLFRVFCGLPPKFVSIRGSQIIQHSAFNIQH